MSSNLQTFVIASAVLITSTAVSPFVAAVPASAAGIQAAAVQTVQLSGAASIERQSAAPIAYAQAALVDHGRTFSSVIPTHHGKYPHD